MRASIGLLYTYDHTVSTTLVKIPLKNEKYQLHWHLETTREHHHHPYEMRQGKFFSQEELDGIDNIDLLNIIMMRDSSQRIEENLF